jgi:3-hydroxyacyl-CoA dehydrogenase
LQERLGIAGSGVIACGLAVTASEHNEVLLWARSSDSAHRAHQHLAKLGAKLEGVDLDRVRIVTDLDELGGSTFLVEAVIEQHDSKVALLSVSANWREEPVPTPSLPRRPHPYRSPSWLMRAGRRRTSSASTSSTRSPR